MSAWGRRLVAWVWRYQVRFFLAMFAVVVLMTMCSL